MHANTSSTIALRVVRTGVVVGPAFLLGSSLIWVTALAAPSAVAEKRTVSKRRSTPRTHRPSTATLIQTLIEVGRPELLKRFRADSCVESTRLVVEFLRSHGV